MAEYTQIVAVLRVTHFLSREMIMMITNCDLDIDTMSSQDVSPQVEPSAEFLNTNDVFVLKTPDSLFLWKGVGSTEEEMTAAKHVASFLGGKVTDVLEGKEPGG